MKDYLPYITDSLSNMHEKISKEYIDALVPYDDIVPTTWKCVAEKLARKVSEYEFPSDAEDSFHPFIDLDDESVKELGLDNVIVCAYKGYEFPWLNIASNFMYMCDNKKGLIIDIYNTVNLSEQDIYNYIVQEFYNFCRDASWIKDGVDIYEANMEKMKNIINEK